MRLLTDTVRKLIQILKNEGIDEIEVRRFWTTIRVARRGIGGSAIERHFATGLVAAGNESRRGETGEAAIVPGEPSPTRESDQSPAAAGDTSSRLERVVSPMVGTFYAAPDPLSEPFVTVGGRINEGDVICIIEAMKIMNEIESETSGVVRKVLVENAQPVEYGQPLFLIESA